MDRSLGLWFDLFDFDFQVDVVLSDGSKCRAAVPSGASTGKRDVDLI